MTRKCNFCGNKKFRAKTVQYILRKNGKFLIMDNVPCEECEFCGEQYFKASDLKKIEARFERLTAGHKKPERRIMVPVERFAA
jgi:YgiT-type zinc finger domain-containing protein